MGHYKSNLRDIEFTLFELLRIQDRLGAAPFEEVDEDTARGILTEVERLAVVVLGEELRGRHRRQQRVEGQGGHGGASLA